MSKRIYVGNLSDDTTEEGLMQAFAAWGPAGVALALDDADRPRGFGFLEIPEDAEATLAIAAMSGQALDGRTLTVYEARPRGDGAGSVEREDQARERAEQHARERGKRRSSGEE
jgi:cold-inducible RNA-binding protein